MVYKTGDRDQLRRQDTIAIAFMSFLHASDVWYYMALLLPALTSEHDALYDSIP